MLPVYGAPAIQTNLVKYLRDMASAWFTTQLRSLEKEGLQNGEGISLWDGVPSSTSLESPQTWGTDSIE